MAMTFCISCSRVPGPEQVCNHPDLFEGRPIVSAFDMVPMTRHLPSSVLTACAPTLWRSVSPALLSIAVPSPGVVKAWEASEIQVRSHERSWFALTQMQDSYPTACLLIQTSLPDIAACKLDLLPCELLCTSSHAGKACLACHIGLEVPLWLKKCCREQHILDMCCSRQQCDQQNCASTNQTSCWELGSCFKVSSLGLLQCLCAEAGCVAMAG